MRGEPTGGILGGSYIGFPTRGMPVWLSPGKAPKHTDPPSRSRNLSSAAELVKGVSVAIGRLGNCETQNDRGPATQHSRLDSPCLDQ